MTSCAMCVLECHVEVAVAKRDIVQDGHSPRGTDRVRKVDQSNAIAHPLVIGQYLQSAAGFRQAVAGRYQQ